MSRYRQAIRIARSSNSHVVRTTAAHRVVTNGPYRLVRHPAYAGMLLAHLGVVVSYFHVVPFVAMACGLMPAVLIRIRHEERVLAKLHGYDAFCATRSRIIPFLW